MDDISREPLPDSLEPTALGDASSVKGPAELLRMAELVVDETQADRLQSDVVETSRLGSEPMRTESLQTESLQTESLQAEPLQAEPVGGRFSTQSDEPVIESERLVPESLAAALAEPELITTAAQPLTDGAPELELMGSGLGADEPPEDAEAAESSAGQTADAAASEASDEPVAAISDDAVDGPSAERLATEDVADDLAEDVAEDAAEEAEAAELYGPPVPEGLLDSHVRKVSSITAAELADEAVPLSEPAEVSKVAMAVMLSTRESLSPMRLAEICNTSQKVVKEALVLLEDELRAQGMPLEVQKSGDGYKLLTVSAVHPYLRRIKGVKKMERLTPAALETLAVIAYRQPVIRAEVESIRGVKVGPMLRSLLDHKMITVIGRADVPGRPLQYGTSQHFLERFGLASLKDLPSIQEFRSLG